MIKIFIAIGYPDKENTQQKEEWIFTAKDIEEARKKANEHFYYFNKVGVWEYNETDN